MSEKVKVRKTVAKNNQVKFGIGSKLMTMFVVLIGVPLLVLGIFTYNKTNEVLKSELTKTSEQVVEQVDGMIVNYLQQFDFVTELLADDANVQQVVSYPDSKEWMIKLFDSILENNPSIMNAYIGTTAKEMVLRPEQGLPEGYDPTGRPWYIDATAAGEKIWTDPYQDASTGVSIISVAKPVKNTFGSNELVGVVSLDVSLETLTDALSSIKIGQHGYAVVLDKNLTILTHPNSEQVGVTLPITEIADAIAAGEAHAEYVFDGTTKFTTIRQVEEYGWYILGTVDESEIADNSKSILTLLVVIGCIALVIALIISFVFSKSLTNNVKKVLNNMEKVKNGDLTSRLEIKSNDELGVLGQFINETMEELSSLISNIKTVSSEVGVSAQNLAATSEEASASAEEVSRTVEEIAKGASEQAVDSEKGVQIAMTLSSKFNHLNERTVEMINSTEEVVKANVHGTDAIEDLKSKTKQADEANDNIENAIKKLDNNTQSISGILDSISAIAVQTNLLALNASIEAARAGEHGKGFAVVAEEIRKLAEESSTSADEIRGITTTIMADSAKTVTSMKEVRNIAKEQTEAVGNVDASFETISTSISTIVSEIQNIKGSVEELTTDKDQIVHAIENISAVSEETAAASEEVSASMDQQSAAVGEVANAAETLNEISVELSNEIGKFEV